MRGASLLLAALFAVLAGCAAPPDDSAVATATGKVVKPYVPTAIAGIPVEPKADPAALQPIIARAGRFGSRSNPFVLRNDEIFFEKAQEAERLFAQDGSFPVNYQSPEPPPLPTPEPQPYRRLSGIVIGDAVVGILETQGADTVIIRPGQLIPGTEWRVVSLNEDRAVLRRPGNRLPREIVVNLEAPPAGFVGAGGASSGVGSPPGSGPGRGRPGVGLGGGGGGAAGAGE